MSSPVKQQNQSLYSNNSHLPHLPLKLTWKTKAIELFRGRWYTSLIDAAAAAVDNVDDD